MRSITTKELYQRIQSGEKITLIDVRTPAEYQSVHIAAAQNIPITELNAEKFTSQRAGATDPVYVVCQSGGRSKQACAKLIAAGLADVIDVEGGTRAWDLAGLPVQRGKKAMSLERQVRIAAGSLVLTGVVLSVLVHPYCIGLSAFVGAGLVFAGVTDFCGMGLLLARMPWNQVAKADVCST